MVLLGRQPPPPYTYPSTLIDRSICSAAAAAAAAAAAVLVNKVLIFSFSAFLLLFRPIGRPCVYYSYSYYSSRRNP
jgi:hypothetical protein